MNEMYIIKFHRQSSITINLESMIYGKSELLINYNKQLKDESNRLLLIKIRINLI